MKYVIIAGILILIGFIIALQFIPIGIEPLTEVYFENHTAIRSIIFPNQAYNFTFTINNLEYRNVTYNYDITYEYNNQTQLAKSESVYIPFNESRTFYETYALPKGFNRVKVEVLVKKEFNNETIDIHFWHNEIIDTIVVVGNRSQ